MHEILSENLIPEIDLEAYSNATANDPNYIDDEDHFSPEEVRAEYFQEVMILAQSVIYLTEAVEITPTSKKAEAELKKQLERLKNHTCDLAYHLSSSGNYFGKDSENYLMRELSSMNITVDTDYNIKVELPEVILNAARTKHLPIQPDLFSVFGI